MRGYVLCIIPVLIPPPNMVTFEREGIIISSGQLAENLLTKSQVWSKSQLNNNRNHILFAIWEKKIRYLHRFGKLWNSCVLIPAVFGSKCGCLRGKLFSFKINVIFTKEKEYLSSKPLSWAPNFPQMTLGPLGTDMYGVTHPTPCSFLLHSLDLTEFNLLVAQDTNAESFLFCLFV